MSDGGREYRNDHGNHLPRCVRKRGRDAYAQVLVKVAVAQVSENAGFQTVQQSALDTLSDVTIRYIRDVGRTVLSYANLAGRSQVNHFDTIKGLEDLSSVQGFGGSLEIDHCLANSGVLREILQYLSDYEEVPFVYDVPRFPIDRDRKRPQSFLQVGDEPPDEHIPEWLPAFPDQKSYNSLVKESDGLPGSRVHDGDLQKFTPQHEKSIPSSAYNGNLDKLNEAMMLNPYLSVPIRIVEKEASPATNLPEKPSWDADEGKSLVMKQNADGNTGAEETPGPAKELVSSKLSASRVRFKIKIGKRTCVSGRIPCSGFVDELSQLIDEGDANSDVKDGVRKILKESMEITQVTGLVRLG